MENAMHIKNGVLAALAAVVSFVAHAIGGWDAAMQVLVSMMIADYVTGILVASVWKRSNKSETGALDSKAGFKGLIKKCLILALVWIGFLLDNAMDSAYIRMSVILFFIGNEGISLLENMGLMGIPFPGFLKNALDALRDQGDNGGA